MDSREARSFLGVYRAGEMDSDARFADAHNLAETDPELARWWAEEQELDRLIAGKMRQAPISEGLKARLIASTAESGNKIIRRDWQRPLLLAAACFVALAAVLGLWPRHSQPAVTVADYRDEMVGFIKVTPALELETSDLSRVAQFLEKKNAPSQFEIPKPLREMKPVGCRTLRFRGHDVSLICFQRGEGKLVHLFVMDRAALADLRRDSAPDFAKEGTWMTAAWAAGDHTYLVAAQGDREQLEKFLTSS